MVIQIGIYLCMFVYMCVYNIYTKHIHIVS